MKVCPLCKRPTHCLLSEREKAREKRVLWLLDNPKVWDGYQYPGNTRNLAAIMKGYGLYSPKTNIIDIREWKLVAEARLRRKVDAR